MNALLTDWLSGVALGAPKQFKNMVVVPVFTAASHSPEYLTLAEALSQNLMTITEISKAGNVPHLKATNVGGSPVLLLDGQELAGAKQNRVLNMSILLKPHSETIIPVSCTEAAAGAIHRGI